MPVSQVEALWDSANTLNTIPSNEEWRDLQVSFTISTVTDAALLKLVPSFLKPYAYHPMFGCISDYLSTDSLVNTWPKAPKESRLPLGS